MIERYRIFYDGKVSDTFDLDEPNAHKIRTVLRLTVGDRLNILTYEKFLQCAISFMSKNRVSVAVISARDTRKPDYELTAYQAIAKREYMDFIIEKYAEIGVTKIVPITTSRSISGLKDNTLERYRNIATIAVLQSEGEFIPTIKTAIDIKKIDCSADCKILFHERLGEKTLPQEICSSTAFIVGSEGGFTDMEYNLLIDKGFKPYNLIDRVLKAETSAIVFASALRFRMKIDAR